MHPKELKIEQYTYDLPDERIARYPLEQRDASKLLVYKNGQIQDDMYRNIAQYIPEYTLLVFNQTKVIHARLLFKKPTGGLIEVFCLEPADGYADVQTAMLQKGTVNWKCLVGGAGKWKEGQVPELHHNDPDFIMRATMIERRTGDYVLQLSWSDESLTFAEVLHYAGKVPLPPYLNRDVEVSDETRYQTIYARDEGSVAAPTAGLHFTKAVMDSLQAKNIDSAYVTLHVGAGTFKPVKSEQMEGHEMHAEWIEVTQSSITQLLTHLDTGIVAVGTTSLRTIESLYWIGCRILKGETFNTGDVAILQWYPYEHDVNIASVDALKAVAKWLQQNNKERLVVRTQIMIAPGYRFRVAKGIVTNFHQPYSTLLLLVAAMVGTGWRDIYAHALKNDYRFLSYGDGCLLWSGNNLTNQ